MTQSELLYADESNFDIVREKSEEDFEYRYISNGQVPEREVREEIEDLAVPPAWSEVKICSDTCRHIRAYGYDEKGRKQYIYNTRWLEERNDSKFARLVEFAKKLPAIRKKARQHSTLKKWTKKKVLGLIVLTLDETYLRIGNAVYEDRNQTYGLTTLRRKHVDISENKVTFQYKGKSNKYRKVEVENSDLIKLIRKSSELPGYEIFRYKSGGKYYNVDSRDVNHYLKDLSGSDFSAKDFRTWGGTTLAVEKIPEAQKMLAQNKRLKLDSTVIKLVARELGNTVSICRDYYIHPKILSLISEGKTDMFETGAYRAKPHALSPVEKKILKIIDE